jgi:hypothetical protein
MPWPQNLSRNNEQPNTHTDWLTAILTAAIPNKQAVINVTKRGGTRSTIDPCQNMITAEARVASV